MDPTPQTIRARLGSEHARLDERMTRLADAAEGADRPALIADWRVFERALRAHLELEEREIFGPVEAIDPSVVADARDDHRRIRALLDELGLQVEIHALRKETVDAFLALLRAHAEREDARLYRLADEALSPEAARGVVAG